MCSGSEEVNFYFHEVLLMSMRMLPNIMLKIDTGLYLMQHIKNSSVL